MARPLRVEYSGACYHVINRGNYRRNIFEKAGSAEAFERALTEAAERFGWRVHAYVVMRNHYHLAIELTEPNLSEGMKWLQGTWVRRTNVFRRQIGRPFQDRFKALLVEPGPVFGKVCHYIHLNPVRAGVVDADHVANYRLSSLPKLLDRKTRPSWLDPVTALVEAGGLRDTKLGWSKYLDYLAFLAADKASQKELAAKQLSRGWCLGTTAFKAEQRKQAKRRGAELDQLRYGGLEAAEIQAEREAAWEEKLTALAAVAKIDLNNLGPKKSDPEKSLLAAAMKKSTSVSNAWLAARLSMGKPASASQFARRVLLDEKAGRKISRILSRIKT